MSEIEKAIETLRKISDIETSNRYRELHEIKNFNYDLLTAIEALQEKLERENGCECCNFSTGDVGSSVNNAGDNFVMIKSENEVSIATDDKHFSLLKINFCPICGRKLTSDLVNVNKIEHIGEANEMVEEK